MTCHPSIHSSCCLINVEVSFHSRSQPFPSVDLKKANHSIRRNNGNIAKEFRYCDRSHVKQVRRLSTSKSNEVELGLYISEWNEQFSNRELIFALSSSKRKQVSRLGELCNLTVMIFYNQVENQSQRVQFKSKDQLHLKQMDSNGIFLSRFLWVHFPETQFVFQRLKICSQVLTGFLPGCKAPGKSQAPPQWKKPSPPPMAWDFVLIESDNKREVLWTSWMSRKTSSLHATLEVSILSRIFAHSDPAVGLFSELILSQKT